MLMAMIDTQFPHFTIVRSTYSNFLHPQCKSDVVNSEQISGKIKWEECIRNSEE